MANEAPVRRLLGLMLGAAGFLVGGLSGLCTGGVLLLVITGLFNSPPHSLGGAYERFAQPFMYSGLFLGVGGAAVVLSGPVSGEPPRRRLAWAALTIAVLILAASLPAAWQVLLHGPLKSHGLEIEFDPRTDRFTTPMAALGGLVLLATAIWELRRRPPQPPVEVF